MSKSISPQKCKKCGNYMWYDEDSNTWTCLECSKLFSDSDEWYIY